MRMKNSALEQANLTNGIRFLPRGGGHIKCQAKNLGMKRTVKCFNLKCTTN